MQLIDGEQNKRPTLRILFLQGLLGAHGQWEEAVNGKAAFLLQ
jgi:hypothetical protein